MVKSDNKSQKIDKKNQKGLTKKTKDKKVEKKIKKPRTLWVRKKKLVNKDLFWRRANCKIIFFILPDK